MFEIYENIFQSSTCVYVNFENVRLCVSAPLIGFVFFNQEGRVTLMLVLSTAVAVVGNSLLYGYNIGVLNTPAPVSPLFCQILFL